MMRQPRVGERAQEAVDRQDGVAGDEDRRAGGDERLAGEPRGDQHRADHAHVDADRHRRPGAGRTVHRGRHPAGHAQRHGQRGHAQHRPPLGGQPERQEAGHEREVADQERPQAGEEPGHAPRQQGDVAEQTEEQGDQQPAASGVLGRAQHHGGQDQQPEHRRLRERLQPPVVARDGVPVDQRGRGRQQPDQVLGHGQSMAGAQQVRSRYAAPTRAAMRGWTPPRSYRSPVTRHRVVSRTGALVARGAAVCAVLLAVVAVLLPVLGGHDYLRDLLNTPELSLALAFSVVGFILLGRAHAFRMGLLVTAIGAVAAVYAAGTSYAAFVLDGDTGATLPAGSTLALTAAWLSNWAWFPASVLVATVYPQVLPYGRPLSPIWRIPLVAAAVCLVLGVLDHATEPGPAGPFRGIDNPLAWPSLHDAAEPLWRAGHGPDRRADRRLRGVPRGPFRALRGGGQVAGRLVRVRRRGRRAARLRRVAGADPSRRDAGAGGPGRRRPATAGTTPVDAALPARAQTARLPLTPATRGRTPAPKGLVKTVSGT